MSRGELEAVTRHLAGEPSLIVWSGQASTTTTADLFCRVRLFGGEAIMLLENNGRDARAVVLDARGREVQGSA